MPSNDDDRFEEKARHFRRRQRDDYDEDDQAVRRPPPSPGVEATDFLIPTNVSGYSIAACYLGLISCLPVVGLVTGVVAILCGIAALRRRNKSRQPGSYGAVTGDIRAVVGIVLGSIGTLFNLPVTFLLIVGALRG
jgi:hypothetical protein